MSPDLQNKLVFRTTKTCQNLLKDSPVCLPNQGLMKGYLYPRPSASLDPGFKSSVLEVPGQPGLKSAHEGGPEMGGAVIAMVTVGMTAFV